MTTYEHDDAGRVTRSYESSPWTAADRALMLAFEQYKATLCPRCSNPKAKAWSSMDPDAPDFDEHSGWWEMTTPMVCEPCTVQNRHGNPEAPPVEYAAAYDTRPYDPDTDA